VLPAEDLLVLSLKDLIRDFQMMKQKNHEMSIYIVQEENERSKQPGTICAALPAI
jgi:hypothetical protein